MPKKHAPLSAAVEDYLRAIYQLQAPEAEVTTTALARQMGVSAASATNMIKKLARMGLVRHSPYRGVILTKTGDKIALEVMRHHRLIELFLNEALGIPWDQVHVEAHRLEHVLSDNLEDHIAEFLGHPTEDPHGDPIPTKAGAIAESEQKPLGDLAPGSRGVVRRVSDQNPEHLRHFSSLGLVPSATVDVLEREPFGGPLHIQVGSSGERVLDVALAQGVWVAPRPMSGPMKRSRKVRRSRHPEGRSR